MPWAAVSRSSSEPIDNWLGSLNLTRKSVPKDSSSLFRAAAEQLCLSQSYHQQMRDLALDYMLLYKNYFSSLIEESLENHIEKMRSPLEWGTHLEIRAMSLIFKADFLEFSEAGILPINVTGFNFKKKVMVYVDSSNHYDIVYEKNRLSIAGFCQALVYETLYAKVFKMEDVRNVVDLMLHDTNSSFRKESINSEGQEKDILRIVQEVMDPAKNTESLHLNTSFEANHSTHGKGLTPPFPYRVAKALDPNIYRNAEHDAWIALKREARFGPYDSKGLQIGVKVCIKTARLSKFISNSQREIDDLHGYIQSLTENQGPVEVFAEELGRRITVPYHSLEKCQSTPTRPTNKDNSYEGSPPSYQMLSTITKTPHLPLLDHYSNSTAAKARRRTYSAPLLPPPLFRSPVRVDRHRNNSECLQVQSPNGPPIPSNNFSIRGSQVAVPSPICKEAVTKENMVINNCEENCYCYCTTERPECGSCGLDVTRDSAEVFSFEESPMVPLRATQEVLSYPVEKCCYCCLPYCVYPSDGTGIDNFQQLSPPLIGCSPEVCGYPINNYYSHLVVSPAVNSAGLEPLQQLSPSLISCSPEVCGYPIDNYYNHLMTPSAVNPAASAPYYGVNEMPIPLYQYPCFTPDNAAAPHRATLQ